MEYEYVKGIGNADPTSSCAVSLWKHRQTNQYFVSNDYKEVITPVIDNRYMLLYQKPETLYSPYRKVLTNPKCISDNEFSTGYIKYNNSVWKLK